MTAKAEVNGVKVEYIEDSWISEKAKCAIQAEAISWTITECCSLLDKNIDPRNIEQPLIHAKGFLQLNK